MKKKRGMKKNEKRKKWERENEEAREERFCRRDERAAGFTGVGNKRFNNLVGV